MLTGGRSYEVEAGQNVELECQFYADTFNLFDYPVVWHKRQHHWPHEQYSDQQSSSADTETVEDCQVNMMGNLLEPFASVGRYQATFVARPPKYLFGLSLTGHIHVKLFYRIVLCRKINSANVRAVLDAFKVKVKVKKLEPDKVLHGQAILELHWVSPKYGVTQFLLAARHKRAHPALTQAGEGWYSIYLPRRDGRLRCLGIGPGIEPMTVRSEVRRPNHCAIGCALLCKFVRRLIVIGLVGYV